MRNNSKFNSMNVSFGSKFDCALPIDDLPSFAYANVLRRQGARRFLPGIIWQSHFVKAPTWLLLRNVSPATLTERTVITFTQGKFKRRTICAFAPKWNFFVTVTINII